MPRSQDVLVGQVRPVADECSTGHEKKHGRVAEQVNVGVDRMHQSNRPAESRRRTFAMLAVVDQTQENAQVEHDDERGEPNGRDGEARAQPSSIVVECHVQHWRRVRIWKGMILVETRHDLTYARWMPRERERESRTRFETMIQLI